MVNYGEMDLPTQLRLTKQLVGFLNLHNIPAIGFVNESKLYNHDSLLTDKFEILEIWVKEGMELGNHSFSHFDYNTTSFKDFSGDIKKGEAITKKLLTEHGKKRRFFQG